MKILVWLTEGTWTACLDAARDLHGDVVLLHVVDPRVADAVDGAGAGLLGRARPPHHRPVADAFAAAQADLLDAAAHRLGRPAERMARSGRPEHEVVAACTGVDLLVVARDGDRRHPGPRSIGPPTRFVVDHATCPMLLIWPGSG